MKSELLRDEGLWLRVYQGAGSPTTLPSLTPQVSMFPQHSDQPFSVWAAPKMCLLGALPLRGMFLLLSSNSPPPQMTFWKIQTRGCYDPGSPCPVSPVSEPWIWGVQTLQMTTLDLTPARHPVCHNFSPAGEIPLRFFHKLIFSQQSWEEGKGQEPILSHCLLRGILVSLLSSLRCYFFRCYFLRCYFLWAASLSLIWGVTPVSLHPQRAPCFLIIPTEDTAGVWVPIQDKLSCKPHQKARGKREPQEHSSLGKKIQCFPLVSGKPSFPLQAPHQCCCAGFYGDTG